MDLDSDIASGKLFSCDKCEVDMDMTDFQQLGVVPKEYEGVKRLKSVVVDAKVVALLKDGETERDEHDIIHSGNSLSNRIIKNRHTQNAMCMFLKTVKRAGHWRRQGAALLRSTSSAKVLKNGSFVKDGKLFVRLGGMSRHGTTKE